MCVTRRSAYTVARYTVAREWKWRPPFVRVLGGLRDTARNVYIGGHGKKLCEGRAVYLFVLRLTWARPCGSQRQVYDKLLQPRRPRAQGPNVACRSQGGRCCMPLPASHWHAIPDDRHDARPRRCRHQRHGLRDSDRGRNLTATMASDTRRHRTRRSWRGCRAATTMLIARIRRESSTRGASTTAPLASPCTEHVSSELGGGREAVCVCYSLSKLTRIRNHHTERTGITKLQADTRKKRLM